MELQCGINLAICPMLSFPMAAGHADVLTQWADEYEEKLQFGKHVPLTKRGPFLPAMSTF